MKDKNIDIIDIKDILAMILVAKDKYYYSLEEDEFEGEIKNIESDKMKMYFCLQKSIGLDNYLWQLEKKLDEIREVKTIHDIILDYDFSGSNIVLLSILSKKLDIKTLRFIYHSLKAIDIYKEYGSLTNGKKDIDLYEDICVLLEIERMVVDKYFVDELQMIEDEATVLGEYEAGEVSPLINKKLLKMN